ncbi:class I SAM-dependent methyltransferase [Fumia xinanensis]|uniref:Class I SAM-dependent methyltransferase n=1 Tax=Fumia xinanensis TaxID=2763659 RepID=A0A926E6F5_9FIRM|nr:class I SAM-dependent methyltransferase [Fumia xinanensis]MBC8560036.1 class I SAM-dependent methyltransferase [Fumia xinanensis]
MIQNKDIDHGKAFDWGRTSADYAKFRDIYPDEFYERIASRGLGVSGQECLDLGTGTGVIPRNMYRYGARWTGADLAENQIREARRLAAESGMDIRFLAAPAEETGLPDGAFELVTAAQCFWYFDPARIFPEIHRMLKPHGHLLLLFMGWLPFESEIAMGTEKLVLKYNPHWTGGGMRRYEPEPPKGSETLFQCAEALGYVSNVPFTRESWHGRTIACRGVGASSLPREEIEAFKKEHWAYMETLPEVFEIPHLVTMVDLQGN